MTTRRIFIIKAVTASAATTVGAFASTQVFSQGAQLSEKDAQAVALAYKIDGTKVDKVKFPKFVVGQNCANCQLYQGKPKEKLGGCPLFAAKQVAASAWCSAWVKKAA